MRWLFVLACLCLATTAVGQDEANPRSISDVAEEARSFKVYLAELGSNATCFGASAPDQRKGESPTDVSSALACVLGLKAYRSDDAQSNDAEVKVYRVLGLDKNALDCNSGILVALAIGVKDAGFKCEEDAVKYVRIPYGANLPYAEVNWGNSLVKRFGSENCGCAAASADGCSASLSATREGNGLRIKGEIDCGVECSVDEWLGPGSDDIEFECKAGALKTIVRLKYDDGCIKAEGKACVKIAGSWQCSGWNNLGKICP